MKISEKYLTLGYKYRKYFVIAILILSILASCIFLFGVLRKTPKAKDYSYLKEYSGQALTLSEDVKVENIKELYYTRQSYGLNTTIFIHDIHDAGKGNGKLILSYQGMRLDFDYDIEIVEAGKYNMGGKETATTIKIISKDQKITGSMIVKISTEGMLTRARAIPAFISFVVVCVVFSIVCAIWIGLGVSSGRQKDKETKEFQSYESKNDESISNMIASISELYSVYRKDCDERHKKMLKSHEEAFDEVALFLAENYDLNSDENKVYRQYIVGSFWDTEDAEKENDSLDATIKSINRAPIDEKKSAADKLVDDVRKVLKDVQNKKDNIPNEIKKNKLKRLAGSACWYLIISGAGCAALQLLFGSVLGVVAEAFLFLIPLGLAIAAYVICRKKKLLEA